MENDNEDLQENLDVNEENNNQNADTNETPEQQNEDFAPVTQKSEEKKEKIVIPKGARTLELKRSVRIAIYIFLCLMSTCNELDDGVLSAQVEYVKLNMNITDSQVGLMESFVFIGVILGSLIAIPMLNKFNRKWVLVVNVFIVGSGVVVYIFVKNMWAICGLRIFLGIGRSFVTVYLPLWIDQFGIASKKTMMLSIVNLGPIIGTVMGQFVSNAIVSISFPWEKTEEDEYSRYTYTMLVQTGVLVLCAIVIAFFPSKYFLGNAKRITQDAMILVQFRPSFVGGRTSIINESQDGFRTSYQQSVFYGEEQDNDNMKEKLDEATGETNKKQELPVCKQLRIALCDPLFTCCAFGVGFFAFSLGAFGYWALNYMFARLKVTNQNQTVLCVMISSIPCPILGSIAAGVIVDLIGGYSTKKAMVFTCILGVIITAVAMVIALPESLAFFTVLLSLMMFLVSALSPPLMGVLISCLRNDIKGLGAGVFEVIYNLIGYLPAPFTFGALKDVLVDAELKEFTKKYGEKEPIYEEDGYTPTSKAWDYISSGTKSALFLTMTVCIIGLILIIIATIFRVKRTEYYDEICRTGEAPKKEENEDDGGEVQLVDNRKNLVSSSGQSFS